MTLLNTTKMTPELLITAPRRSDAVPNHSGSHALYTTSTYSLESHSEKLEIWILNIRTGITTLFSDDDRNKDPQWLVGSQVLWLREGDTGVTELWIGTAGEAEKNAYFGGSISAPISNVKTKELVDGTIAFAFNAEADSKGSLFNHVTTSKTSSSAREYETAVVRFWDTYYKRERSSLWFTTLKKVDGGRYELSEQEPINALKGTLLEHPISPTDPLAGLGYDISRTGLLFKARDPDYNPGITTRFSIFYLRLLSFTESSTSKVRKIVVPDYEGFASHPVFSPEGNSAAFLHTKIADTEYDWNRVFMIGKLDHDESMTSTALDIQINSEHWGLSPDTITWANNGKELYVTASERGRQKLFVLPLGAGLGEPIRSTVPVALSKDGTVTSVFPLSTSKYETRLFVNKTSLVESSVFTIIDAQSGKGRIVSSATAGGSALGLSSSQVSEIEFKGEDDGYSVHAWVVKPSNFQATKFYPLCLLIHGGPLSAWSDAWSTRWNPAVFAEQGYIVVAPNVSGSSGFGQDFANSVRGAWGGRPYVDLVKCFEHIEKNFAFVDINRTVALGGSYGGYMVNWIAGQPLAKRLKALVCHDGIFSNYNMMSADYVTTLPEEMGGFLWTNKSNWDKYDPAQFTKNWSTPMLIIHSDNDFRCPITEGLAVFNVCQQLGIKSRFLNFPDENHFVLKRENSLRWYKTVLGWINKYAEVEGGVELKPPICEPRPIWNGAAAKR